MNDLMTRLCRIETMFSCNNYNGCSPLPFEIVHGNIPVMFSAPHAVNFYRADTVKYAEKFTGAIANYMNAICDCHIIYASTFSQTDFSRDPIQRNLYKNELVKYAKRNGVKLIIDLHGVSKSCSTLVQLDTAEVSDSQFVNPSVREFVFVPELLEYLFTKNLASPKESYPIVSKRKDVTDSIVSYLTNNSTLASIQVDLNSVCRDPAHADSVSDCLRSLTQFVKMFCQLL